MVLFSVHGVSSPEINLAAKKYFVAVLVNKKYGLPAGKQDGTGLINLCKTAKGQSVAGSGLFRSSE